MTGGVGEGAAPPVLMDTPGFVCVCEVPDPKLGFLSALPAGTQQDCKKKIIEKSAPGSKTL